MNKTTTITGTILPAAPLTGTILTQGLPGPKGDKGDTGTVETLNGTPLVTSVDHHLPDSTGNVTTRVYITQDAYNLIRTPDQGIDYYITD